MVGGAIIMGDNDTKKRKREQISKTDNESIADRTRSRTRMKSDESPVPCEPRQKMSFLDMNDDCIMLICEQLPIEHLCLFSRTSPYINRLTHQFFYHHYKEHRMEIVNQLQRPYIATQENYARYFRKSVRSVRLISAFANLQPIRLFQFLRLNCCENLRELEFDTMDFDTLIPHAKEIEHQLANITSISFINCTESDIYNGCLRHCSNLEHLSVKEERQIHINYKWLVHKYPKLRSLIYHENKYYDVPPYPIFFHLNPRIKKVSCSDDRIVRYISTHTNIVLDYLMLRFENSMSFSRILNLLYLMCMNGRINRLKFDFACRLICCANVIAYMAKMPMLTAFDFVDQNSTFYLCAYHPVMYFCFPQITSLKLEMQHPLDVTVVATIAHNFPNLQEIDFQPWSHAFYQFALGIGKLAANLKDLHTIVVRLRPEWDMEIFDVRLIDFVRRLIPNACPLKIYLPHKQLKRCRISADSLVTVEPISSFKRDIYASELRL